MGKIPKKGEIPKIQGKKTPAFNQTWLKGYFCWTNVNKVGQDIKIYISIVCFFLSEYPWLKRGKTGQAFCSLCSFPKECTFIIQIINYTIHIQNAHIYQLKINFNVNLI